MAARYTTAHRAALIRYANLWRDVRPPSLTGLDVLTAHAAAAPGAPTPIPAARVHRDVILHGRSGIPRAAWAPLSVWLWARWRFAGGKRAAAQIANSYPKRTAMDGVPMSEVRRRLARLERAHGVPVRDALWFGLFRDGHADRWIDYAYDIEAGWNLVASRPLGVTADEVDLLTDKRRTARELGALGIPVVPEIATTRPGGRGSAAHQDAPAARQEAVAAQARQWLDAAAAIGAGAIHLKTVAGSRGEGAFTVRPRLDSPRGISPGTRLDPADDAASSPATFIVVPYQSEIPVADPLGYILDRLAEAPYLVQPLLETHPALAHLADPGDVVTVRIVTLYPGAATRVFSCMLEVPLPATRGDDGEERRYYCLMPIASDGTITGDVLPEWLRSPPSSDAGGTSDADSRGLSDNGGASSDDANPTERIVRALTGTALPLYPELVHFALRAHAACPRIFSVAWDVALTPSGWVLLEGNTGYGARHPQTAAGPILIHAP